MVMSNAHMMTNDIDWFCIVDHQYPIHLASNGSIIPHFAADRRDLLHAQRVVARVPFWERNELQYNEEHIEELGRLEGFDRNRYLWSFRFFAEKGFYSFDYEWRGDEGEYIFLVKPKEPRKCSWREYLIHQLPHVPMDELNERDRLMFERILNQIRRME